MPLPSVLGGKAMSRIMNRVQRRAASKHMASESTKYPAHLVLVPKSEYESTQPPGQVMVWRSRDYLVQIFRTESPEVFCRMSVCRTKLDNQGGWQQDIPWEDLQRLKSEVGYGELDAVEVYPADADVINVANMRHLFVMFFPLDFAWRKS